MEKLLFIFIALVYNGPIPPEGPAMMAFNPDLIVSEKVINLSLEECQKKLEVLNESGKINFSACIRQEVKEDKKK